MIWTVAQACCCVCVLQHQHPFNLWESTRAQGGILPAGLKIRAQATWPRGWGGQTTCPCSRWSGSTTTTSLSSLLGASCYAARWFDSRPRSAPNRHPCEPCCCRLQTPRACAQTACPPYHPGKSFQWHISCALVRAKLYRQFCMLHVHTTCCARTQHTARGAGAPPLRRDQKRAAHAVQQGPFNQHVCAAGLPCRAASPPLPAWPPPSPPAPAAARKPARPCPSPPAPARPWWPCGRAAQSPAQCPGTAPAARVSQNQERGWIRAVWKASPTPAPKNSKCSLCPGTAPAARAGAGMHAHVKCTRTHLCVPGALI